MKYTLVNQGNFLTIKASVALMPLFSEQRIYNHLSWNALRSAFLKADSPFFSHHYLNQGQLSQMAAKQVS